MLNPYERMDYRIVGAGFIRTTSFVYICKGLEVDFEVHKLPGIANTNCLRVACFVAMFLCSEDDWVPRTCQV